MAGTDFLSQLEEFRREFHARLPERVSLLEGALKRWQQAPDDASLHEAVSEAHKLAGSGSTFGVPALSDAARELEDALVRSRDAERSADPAMRDAIGTAFQALRAAATAALTPRSSESPPPQPSQAPSVSEPRPAGGRLVFLVDDDPHLRDSLALQLGYFGYAARVFSSPQEMRPTIDEARPVAIVMDIMFPEGDLAGPRALGHRERKDLAETPVVFFSSRTDFEARLEAVRAGGVSYLRKPLDISALVNTLDSLAPIAPRNPYRVLIVEDEENLAAYYAKLLQAADIEATYITDPAQIDEVLGQWVPDLILMDLYMPRCNGVELAALLRQQEAYVGVPIVFLSAETDLDKQLLALRQGGDDFLVKPIEPAHLVSVVTSRAQRSRVLRAYMTHDGLTGLLNHTKLKERLETEVLRSRRHGHPLVYAMIDLDEFKSVNDTRGHAAGDRVLRNLSRMLVQRLRRTDVAGRYGGDEFGVVLTETGVREAEKVLEAFCRDFAAIRHGSGPDAFKMTLSCGLAEFQSTDSVESLLAAADAALYEAKHGGRNRVAAALRIAAAAKRA